MVSDRLLLRLAVLICGCVVRRGRGKMSRPMIGNLSVCKEEPEWCALQTLSRDDGIKFPGIQAVIHQKKRNLRRTTKLQPPERPQRGILQQPVAEVLQLLHDL